MLNINESEVIFKKNTKFRITSSYNKNKKIYIELEEVQNEKRLNLKIFRKERKKIDFIIFQYQKKTKVNTNTPFMREIHKLVNGEIDEIDLKKVKRDFKTDQNRENIKEK